MSIYDELGPAVRDAFNIAKQGHIQLAKVVRGAGSIDEPGEPVETLHTLPATARGVRFAYVQSGLADARDSEVSYPALPNVPAPAQGDFVLIDGARLKVQRIITKPDAGTPLAYTLIVRR